MRAQIGYQVIGGTKFYERAEIKDAVAYLTFLVNPQDGGAFTRIANSPRRGLGQTSLSRVLAHADDDGHHRSGRRRRRRTTCPALGTAARKALGRFMSTMERLRERVEGGAPVGELLDELLRETGYLDALEAERTIEAQGRHREPRGARARRARVRRDAPRSGSLGEFLQQIALLADADTLRDDEGLVTLMTLHNAKGLEFPIVFMIGMEDGVFPHSRALDEGDARGGAPARLRRHHARDARPHAHLRAPPQRRSAAQSLRHALALHRRDPARADRPAGRSAVGAGLPARRAASRRGRAPRRPPPRPAAATTAARSSASATTSSTPRSARAS